MREVAVEGLARSQDGDGPQMKERVCVVARLFLERWLGRLVAFRIAPRARVAYLLAQKARPVRGKERNQLRPLLRP